MEESEKENEKNILHKCIDYHQMNIIYVTQGMTMVLGLMGAITIEGL